MVALFDQRFPVPLLEISTTLPPWQKVVALPALTVGVAAVFTVIFNVCAEEEPQELFAVTDSVPLVVFAVAFIVFDVELPVHPEGRIHV